MRAALLLALLLLAGCGVNMVLECEGERVRCRVERAGTIEG